VQQQGIPRANEPFSELCNSALVITPSFNSVRCLPSVSCLSGVRRGGVWHVGVKRCRRRLNICWSPCGRLTPAERRCACVQASRHVHMCCRSWHASFWSFWVQNAIPDALDRGCETGSGEAPVHGSANATAGGSEGIHDVSLAVDGAHIVNILGVAAIPVWQGYFVMTSGTMFFCIFI
jgi:hypothetical protein